MSYLKKNIRGECQLIKVQILKTGTFWPFSVEFISETLTDRRNMEILLKGISQHIQFKLKKNPSKLDEKYKILYNFQICEISEVRLLLNLFLI